MTDRELLELAAKAAGIAGEYRAGLGICPPELSQLHKFWWNPLTDDGDALRLAANLRLDIVFAHDEVCVNWVSKTDCEYFEVPHGEDRMAATRRAITLAAAAMGREMP